MHTKQTPIFCQDGKQTKSWRPSPGLGLALCVIFTGFSGSVLANQFCSQTAEITLKACLHEARDDFLIARGKCVNLSDPVARQECREEAQADQEESRELCAEQRTARGEVCNLIGEERYDPDFSPANFVHPNQIGKSVSPNPYFPLVPGTRWVYRGGGERIIVRVTHKTKLIDGVTCRVLVDVVKEDGVEIEITGDWYAQDTQGNVWYCGEIARNFETFDGDRPEDPELVDIDGSWKAGRDGAKAGIIMFAAPQVGVTYREEIALGEAEDVAEVVSDTGTESVPAASCNNNCVVTRNFTAIEPGAEEFKYYALGVGPILEIDGEGGRVELIKVVTP